MLKLRCMNMIASPLRRALNTAFFVSVPATAAASKTHDTGWPGVAPAAPKPLPVYVDPRVGSFYVTSADQRLQPVIVDMKRFDACLATIRRHAGNRPAARP